MTDGWHAMLTCLADDALIGTITPFSNNATICSFPTSPRVADTRARGARTHRPRAAAITGSGH